LSAKANCVVIKAQRVQAESFSALAPFSFSFPSACPWLLGMGQCYELPLTTFDRLKNGQIESGGEVSVFSSPRAHIFLEGLTR
jgi:hypothetical protein